MVAWLWSGSRLGGRNASFAAVNPAFMGFRSVVGTLFANCKSDPVCCRHGRVKSPKIPHLMGTDSGKHCRCLFNSILSGRMVKCFTNWPKQTTLLNLESRKKFGSGRNINTWTVAMLLYHPFQRCIHLGIQIWDNATVGSAALRKSYRPLRRADHHHARSLNASGPIEMFLSGDTGSLDDEAGKFAQPSVCKWNYSAS